MERIINETRKKLGEQIRHLRKSAGLTQEELGEKAALSYKYIGELERGRVNVSIDSLVRISGALRVKPENLLSKVKFPVQKIIIKEKNPLSKLSAHDRHVINKALRLLNKIFSS